MPGSGATVTRKKHVVPPGAEDSYARSGLASGNPPPFTHAQKRQFEADTAAERSLFLFRRGLLGLAFFVAYLGVDWLLTTPDVMVLSLVLRLADKRANEHFERSSGRRAAIPHMRRVAGRVACPMGRSGRRGLLVGSRRG
jgi:hypothetical protein